MSEKNSIGYRCCAAWPLANQLLMPGAMGVDLFFIISGFIMCYSMDGARGD